jgi:hypothetical protein
MTKRKLINPILPNNYAIREITADGIPVGRCYFAIKNGVCPRHGDVRGVQIRYAASGELTDEHDLPMIQDCEPVTDRNGETTRTLAKQLRAPWYDRLLHWIFE